MQELKNLNKLGRGFRKKWIWGTKENYCRSCDYIQKISYCIEDLNVEIKNLTEPSMKEIVFIIVLVDWICESVEAISNILIKGIMDDYFYKRNENLLQYQQFFKAIRSFVVAHPLSTNRHKKYGLDGDFICVDVGSNISAVVKAFTCSRDWFYLDFNGLKENDKAREADFVLSVYSQKADGMQAFKYIGVDFKEIYKVAELQIEKIYDMDRYLGKLKRKNWR